MHLDTCQRGGGPWCPPLHISRSGCRCCRSCALTGLRTAGQRRIPDATACLCSKLLAQMLSLRQMCERMPGKERIRSMRYLYTILQWTSQRIAETVRDKVQVRAELGAPEPGAGLHCTSDPLPRMPGLVDGSVDVACGSLCDVRIGMPV